LCLEVQGHYDEATFKEATIAAFGGVAAAQHARARGRANSVLSKLTSFGVAEAQLKETLPLSTPTFRGATITLRSDCGNNALDARQMNSLVQDATRELLLRDQSIVAAAVSKEVERLQAERPAPSAPAARMSEGLAITAFGDVGAALGMLAFPNSEATDNSGNLMLWLGGGATFRHAYLRAQLATTLGSAAEQRLGVDGALAGGYQQAFWQAGVRLSSRMSSYSFSDPKLDQSWDVGVEGSECLWRVGPVTLCAYQYLAPAGRLHRDGEVNHSQVERIPTRKSYVTRLDIGLVARYATDSLPVLFP
jgi:hypothetical protein